MVLGARERRRRLHCWLSRATTFFVARVLKLGRGGDLGSPPRLLISPALGSGPVGTLCGFSVISLRRRRYRRRRIGLGWRLRGSCPERQVPIAVPGHLNGERRGVTRSGHIGDS